MNSYESTIILKVRFFLSSINWPPLIEKLDLWKSAHILTTLTGDHKKNSEHHRSSFTRVIELLAFEKLKFIFFKVQ